MSTKVLAVLAALIAAVSVSVVFVVVDDHEAGKPRGTKIVTLGGPGNKKVALPPPAQEIAKTQLRQDKAGDEVDAHADLRTEIPNASDPQTLREMEQMKPVGQADIPKHIPLASPELPGCRSYPVRNYSSRGGAPILVGWTHWTAGPNTFPSWNGILGTVRWFDIPGSQASSNEIIDAGGQCAIAVAEALKSWTQSNYNRSGVSVEITNRGTHPILTAAGVRRLAWLYAGWHRRWKIPLQRARVVQGLGRDCPTVLKPGIAEHRDGGPCAGGHPDVGGSPQVDEAIRLARKIVYGTKKLTKQEKWAARHAALHVPGGPLSKCRGRGETDKCKTLRSRNRTYHQLLTRKP